MAEAKKKVYDGHKKNTPVAKQSPTKPAVKKTPAPKPEIKKALAPVMPKPKPKPKVKAAKKTKHVKPKLVTPMASRKANTSKARLAMFIDVDNVGISRENLMEILFFANGKYQIELCKLYGFSEETLPGIKEIANDYNLEIIGKMKFKTLGKNCLDPRILLDAYECAINNQHSVDTIFVWCYPCDLTPVFEKINKLGIATTTINNPVFDCKNKFVSQAFKLYSQYDFSVDGAMYGQIQNTVKESSVKPVSPTPSPISTQTVSMKSPEPSKPQNLDNDAPVPVLPRREIPERSNHSNLQQDPNAASIVDSISRKLNLRPANDEPEAAASSGNDEPEKKSDENMVSLIDVIKKAGFADFNSKVKDSEKYEDTIGDL